MRPHLLASVLVVFLLLGFHGALAQETPESRPATTQPSDAGPVRLVLPPVIYAVRGVETNVYLDNIVLVLDRDDYAFEVICDQGNQFSERWTFTPGEDDAGEYPFDVLVRDESNAVVARGRSLLRVSPSARERGRSTTLLIVGDSLTQASVYPQHLLELDARDPNFELRLIGSRGAGNRPATGPLRHEGYNGWTAQAFATMDGTLSRTGEYKRPETGSPFVYTDASAGPKLDVARYFGEFNEGKAPDAVTILLGANDVFRADDTTIDATIERMLGHYDRLVDALREDPGTTVGIVLPVPPSRSQDGFRHYRGAGRQTRWQYRRNIHRLIEAMVGHYGGREAERIQLVPAYLNLDTENGYPLRPLPATAGASSGSATRPARVIDGVHPSPEGYRQIGDSLYCWLKALGAGDR